MDKIIISDLELQTHIGTTAAERERPQRLSPVQPLDEAPAPVANGEPVPVPAH